ncbi:glycine cleavage system protein R [Nocardioides limicola]|uniref:glycine cleavage system protein R n=1 Tax=Nocardioides limicola TaxID=2803368 RepID=UPI00193B2693|nr:ACT domain-containing protein [Nocardioides sp. DJM-14]
MTLHAITVLGHDRPGIIAETTEALAGLGLNIEDSTMTLLRGHFAMMLICSGEATGAAVSEALRPLTGDGSLDVSVREVPVEEAKATEGTSWVLTVHGGDRPGIVSTITGVVASAGGNITDLTTRLAGDLYLLIAEVDLPRDGDVAAIRSTVAAAADGLGVRVTWHEAEADEL